MTGRRRPKKTARAGRSRLGRVCDAEMLMAESVWLRAESLLDKNVIKGKMTKQEKDETLGRLSIGRDWNDLGQVDFVVEVRRPGRFGPWFCLMGA